jgi:hypothetical protein
MWTPRELRYFQSYCWQLHTTHHQSWFTFGLDKSWHITTSPLHFTSLL